MTWRLVMMMGWVVMPRMMMMRGVLVSRMMMRGVLVSRMMMRGVLVSRMMMRRLVGMMMVVPRRMMVVTRTSDSPFQLFERSVQACNQLREPVNQSVKVGHGRLLSEAGVHPTVGALTALVTNVFQSTRRRSPSLSKRPFPCKSGAVALSVSGVRKDSIRSRDGVSNSSSSFKRSPAVTTRLSRALRNRR